MSHNFWNQHPKRKGNSALLSDDKMNNFSVRGVYVCSETTFCVISWAHKSKFPPNSVKQRKQNCEMWRLIKTVHYKACIKI